MLYSVLVSASYSLPYRRLFSNRNFLALWVGQLIAFIGDYFNWLAIPIMVNRLTGSALMTGLSVISATIPSLVLGPLAGVFVDRWNRKWTMIVSDLLRALVVLSLLLVRSADQVWIFYVEGFVAACISQFFFPARMAVLPLIVQEKEDWLAANGMMQVIQMVGLIFGPALAGFLIGLWSEKAAFIGNSLGFLLSAGCILLITVPRTVPAAKNLPASRLPSIWLELREGLAYLFASQRLVGVVSGMSIVMLGFGAIQVVWVPYLQRAFGVGAAGLGIVDSVQGVGMLIGALLLGLVYRHISKGNLAAGGILLAGMGIAVMGLAPEFLWIIIVNFPVGIAILLAQASMNTIMQEVVPDEKRGRVGGSFNAITTAASLLSMALASGFGESIGLKNVYLITGAIIALAGFLGFWLFREPQNKDGGSDSPVVE